ncbi:amino acid transporter [Nocardioides ginsengisegetis]|uniref:Amino acid transporter n=1 Tax=Nocardioides ginsengisegetis TaxID=661491 RepID=A0A7W3J138_9ACTN|nr:APC family permease [Nocardioides ginsengisegetis]MBA8804219.1 amino acid transporter [Nocardioides ginsengisegetis]
MTTTQAPSPGTKKRNTKLVREVGIIGLTWASMGSIIGSGWLFGPQEALIAAGPAAIISWVIGGVAIVVLALVHAELGGMYPVSGGTARFPHYAFGGVAGASFGWFAWLNAATVAPIEVSAMLTYAGHYDFANGWINPDNGVLSFTGIVVAIILMAILTAINFLGVKKLAATNSAATWWKIAIPMLTILVLAIANFDTSNLTAANGFNPAGLKGIFAAVSTGGIIFSYLGFEQADQLAGESANPKRDVPFAIIGSVVFGTILYILLQLVFLFALPKSAIGDTWDQVGNGLYTTFTGPFAEIASLLSIGWLAAIIYADAIISPGGTGLIYTTGSSRLAYGLSRNGYVPSAFEWTNKRNVPWVGLLAAFITGCICFLPFPSWQSLVGLITSASVLMYGGAPLSLGAFRRRLPNAERPYRLPAAGFLSPVAFIIANLIILWTGWDTIWKLGITILIGYAILVANRVFKLNEHKPTLDWKAASWLIPYLIGMGVIVYISDFGPKGDDALIPFGWDALVVAAWSLVVYYWAMAVALSTEQIEEMIGEVEEPEEGMAPAAH